MKILVTGGAGFIGSHLVESLLNLHEVIVIDYSTENIVRNLQPMMHPNLKIYDCDIRLASNDLLIKLINGIDVIIHLAALADIVPSISDPVNYYNTNVSMTLALLEIAHKCKVKKFIYAASSSCYGFPDELPVDEACKISPQYPYALTKWMGEELVRHWGLVYKLPWISLRLFNVYGPRSRTNGTYGAMFGTFLAQKLAGKPYTIVGNGKQERDFVYISDVVRAFEAAINTNRQNEVYNVGSGEGTDILKIVRLLGGESIHIPKRPGEPQWIQADISKIKKELGWEPRIYIEKGIDFMLENIDYWKDAPVWTEKSIDVATKSWFNCLGK